MSVLHPSRGNSFDLLDEPHLVDLADLTVGLCHELHTYLLLTLQGLLRHGVSLVLEFRDTVFARARLVKGLGYDWRVMQLGETSYQVPSIPADSIDVFFYSVPFWPIYKGKSNRIAVSVDGSEPQVFENQFKEYSRSWKDQVLRNGVACRLRFPIDRSKTSHTHTFSALDPGQMLQKVIIDWGGLQQSYLGPSVTWHPLQSWMISEQPPSLP